MGQARTLDATLMRERQLGQWWRPGGCRCVGESGTGCMWLRQRTFLDENSIHDIMQAYSTHLRLACKNVLLVIEMDPDRRSFSWYIYCNQLDIIKLNTRSLSRFKSSTNNTRSYISAQNRER